MLIAAHSDVSMGDGQRLNRLKAGRAIVGYILYRALDCIMWKWLVY